MMIRSLAALLASFALFAVPPLLRSEDPAPATSVDRPATADEVVPATRVRETIAEALPYIVEWGDWWREDKDCVSCHRGAFTTASLALAADRGLEVDADHLDEFREWSRSSMLVTAKNEKTGVERLVALGNLEGAAQILWYERNRPSVAPEGSTDGLRKALLEGQQESGVWKAGGQLPFQKRPKPETEIVSTMWGALALGLFDDDDSRAGRKRAMEAIDATKPGRSTEWFAMRLLLAARDRDDPAVAKWTKQLLSHQREDGGWGWLVADPSDALATGQAMESLLEAGIPADDPALQRAVRFLVDTQDDDGSWAVNGTKTKGKDGPEETASYWGTCWAVIALARTLPERAGDPKPTP